MNISSINASITRQGVTVKREDRDLVLSRKGAPASNEAIASWSAIAALVRVGVADHVANRMAEWGDTTQIHPKHVADILANNPKTPHVVIRVRDIANVEVWTETHTKNATTTLSNLFRLHTLNGNAPRFGDRIGASCKVSWTRLDEDSFAFIAN